MRLLTVILGCLTVATACPAQQPAWTLIRPTASPPNRSAHGMAYDSSRQRTVMFGGYYGRYRGDTWEWDGKQWAQIKPTTSPSARFYHAMVYDSGRGRTVLFGGAVSTSRLGDTWEWDGKLWTLIKPTTSPSPRAAAGMAYDSARQRTVLFGGLRTGGLADTWEWDGKIWTLIKPTTSPSARFYHAMVYDSARRRTVLFGGYNFTNRVLGDTWEWDGRNWTLIKPATSPAARQGHAMAYGAARQRTVLFGGGTDLIFGVLGDTWEWDGRNWALIRSTTSPSARGVAAMAHDSVRQRAVLFGGYTRNNVGGLKDTWEYGIAKLTLTANTLTISIANGGTQTLTLNAGTGLGSKLYWIFGSMTGTMPGVVLTGIHIPLVPDVYTDIAIGAVNTTVFTKFRGTLGATGAATASLNVPAKLPIPVEFKLHHAYVVYDGATGQIFTSSNPVPLTLVK